MNRRIIALGYLAIINVFLPTFSKAEMVEGRITRISDGDTVLFSPANASSSQRPWRIRMIGMDAPEQHLPTDHGMVGQDQYGEQATAHLLEMIQVGSQVTLETHGTDRYGRVLGRIYSNGTDVNLQMVRDGWAIPYIICEGRECQPGVLETERAHEYFSACAEARTAGLGIFSPENPLTEMPFEFRLRMQHRQPEKFVADYYTHQLFQPDEYSQVDVCRRIFFMNQNDAQRLGFHLDP